MEKKIDFKKKLKQCYNPSDKEPTIVKIPKMQFLMIEGIGTTQSESFQEAIQGLFGVSYKIKFISKKEKGTDYVVMPLEGLWWADDMSDFVKGHKDKWKWILMIMQPDFITHAVFDAAMEEVRKKNNTDALNLLRLDDCEEGLSAQILHMGPFSEEHQNIIRIHDLIKINDGKFDGQRQRHHEIYLSDFRKAAPEKLKTILRQPFVK